MFSKKMMALCDRLQEMTPINKSLSYIDRMQGFYYRKSWGTYGFERTLETDGVNSPVVFYQGYEKGEILSRLKDGEYPPINGNNRPKRTRFVYVP